MPDPYRVLHPDGAPHCDARVLHAPGECDSCDKFPDWQLCRDRWGMAFSGHTPTGDQVGCPADRAVESGERGDYGEWGGNRRSGEAGEDAEERFYERKFHSLREQLKKRFGV